MIARTQGIVLRTTPHTETSRVVAWLTPDHGRIATLIKGSHRPKSWFLGQYDLFYTCELLFYGRERADLLLARECYPLKTRDRLRRDWRAAATASYLTDLIARAAPQRAPQPSLYALLDKALDWLASEGSSPGFVLWCELKLLHELGLSPRLRECVACRRPLAAQAPPTAGAWFAYARGGLLCDSCAHQSPDRGLEIAPATMAALRAWQAAENPAKLPDTPDAGVLRAAEVLLGRFLAYHLETNLPSRALTLKLLRNPARPPPAGTA